MKSRIKIALASTAIFLNACGQATGNNAPDESTPSANNAPVIANANGNQTAIVGSVFQYDATQNGSTFSDADGDNLSYAVSFNPQQNGLSADNGFITGTPSQTGSISLTVTASDGNGGETSNSFVINVNSAASAGKPNIIFVITDDQGKDASAEYSLSSDLPATPNISALANNGVVFENLWVSPTCSPTRAALISGKYGHQTNVLAPGDDLPTGEVILQSFLKGDTATSDYNSAFIGKWHLGGGRTAANDFGIEHFVGINSGAVPDYYNWNLNDNGTVTTSTNYVTTELTDQAIDWVSGQSQPWFLWLAYNAPHDPFHLPPTNLHSRSLSGDAADITANPRDYYLASIEAMDTEFGRLMSSLSTEDRENTLVIYIGDNGTPNQVKDRSVLQNGSKDSLFEGGVNTPMFVSGAGIARNGEREDSLITHTDFFPTIVELAGGTLANYQDGTSFVNLLTSPATSSRDYSYTNHADGWTIRDETNKLIEDSSGSQELYDLISDPAETTDLLNSSVATDAILADLDAEARRIRGE